MILAVLLSIMLEREVVCEEGKFQLEFMSVCVGLSTDFLFTALFIAVCSRGESESPLGTNHDSHKTIRSALLSTCMFCKLILIRFRSLQSN